MKKSWLIRIVGEGWKTGALFVLAFVVFAGCASDKALERVTSEQAATIQSLNEEMMRLNSEMDGLLVSREDLARAKEDLERKLKRELASGDLEISMEDRGLVVTVLDRILFDSGTAELKNSSKQTLNKVADVLKDKVGRNMIFIEGHTDNEPIRYSGWKSNWELSTARATEVIHYFVGENHMMPQRIAAAGYGEFQPVADNATREGRLKNRRVEIIISPKKIVTAGTATSPRP